MHYSASTRGFYDDSIHTEDQIPSDAMEITSEQHRELLSAQSTGKRIVPNVDGLPVAVDPPALTQERLAINAGLEFSDRIRNAADQMGPLLDAEVLGELTQPEEVSLHEWRVYRIALMRTKDQSGYPNEISWPVKPE